MDNNSKIYTDDNGDQWLIDDNGKLLVDETGRNIPPTHSRKISEDGNLPFLIVHKDIVHYAVDYIVKGVVLNIKKV